MMNADWLEQSLMQRLKRQFRRHRPAIARLRIAPRPRMRAAGRTEPRSGARDVATRKRWRRWKVQQSPETIVAALTLPAFSSVSAWKRIARWRARQVSLHLSAWFFTAVLPNPVRQAWRGVQSRGARLDRLDLFVNVGPLLAVPTTGG